MPLNSIADTAFGIGVLISGVPSDLHGNRCTCNPGYAIPDLLLVARGFAFTNNVTLDIVHCGALLSAALST
jgi:hypothetical protein